MKHQSFRGLVAAIAVSALFSGPVYAHDDDAKDRAIAAAANLIVPEQAGEKALAIKAGTITDIDLDRKWRNYYYEVEIVDADAVEWEIRVDAKTGEIRGVKRDWFD